MLGAWKHVERSSRMAAREAAILDHEKQVSKSRTCTSPVLAMASPFFNPERHGPGAKEDDGIAWLG